MTSAASSYEERLRALKDAKSWELADLIRPAVMLSMSFTGQKLTRFDHVTGTIGSWTHDDYDVAHAALNELALRLKAIESNG